MESIETIKLLGIILGATGFWKVIEYLMRQRLEKRISRAQASIHEATANSQIVENWVGWSQKLEGRVKELELLNSTMNETIKKQRERINQLVKQVEEWKEKNSELSGQLNALKTKYDE